MTPAHDNSYYVGLVRELCKLPQEPEWAEFKVDNQDPQRIGEYLSALSNAAALCNKPYGYLLWGVEDGSHQIVGTRFDPAATKKGAQPLESWLLQLLKPRQHFCFITIEVDGKRVVVLEVEQTKTQPVAFNGLEYIRIGEVKKPLKEAPAREQQLWRSFDEQLFEFGVAAERLDEGEALKLLDYAAYFDLLEQPLPENRKQIIAAIAADGLIEPSDAGGWDITNLGAILFAKRMDSFPTLRRKATRVIQYRGIGRIETLKEQVGTKGYACGFEGLVDYINGLLPANEVIGQALRKSVPMFPELAVRELVANALIHQDFTITGTGPMIEIFDDRVEVTNPGEPLVTPDRFVDSPPRSRNDTLASLMRRFRICEERGSGIDKVITQVEMYQLPAPLFEAPDGFTRTVLFAHKELTDMDKPERVRACYLHACLCFVTRRTMTNATLRERFGIEEKNSAAASRLLNEAVEANRIVVQDPSAGTRNRSYLPFWAAPAPDEPLLDKRDI